MATDTEKRYRAAIETVLTSGLNEYQKRDVLLQALEVPLVELLRHAALEIESCAGWIECESLEDGEERDALCRALRRAADKLEDEGEE